MASVEPLGIFMTSWHPYLMELLSCIDPGSAELQSEDKGESVTMQLEMMDSENRHQKPGDDTPWGVGSLIRLAVSFVA
jgi:hypothetical protein